MSVYWDILEKVRELIISDGPLAGAGTIPAIPEDNVTFIKLPTSKDAVDEFKGSGLSPGIVIGFAGKVISDPTEGNNSNDTVKYPVVILGIDRDFATFEDERIQVWLDRAEAMRQLFHMGNAKAEVPNITLSWAQPQDVFEERYSYLYDYAVFVLPLIFKGQEGRNPAGTG